MRRWMLAWLLIASVIMGGLSLAGGNPAPAILYAVLATGGLAVEFTREHRERVWKTASVNRVLFNIVTLSSIVVLADLVLTGLAVAAPSGEKEPFVVLAVALAPLSLPLLWFIVVGSRRFKSIQRSSDPTDEP